MTKFINGAKPTNTQPFELTPNTNKTETRIAALLRASSPRQWLLARYALTALDVAA
jgi:hypothetical protein